MSPFGAPAAPRSVYLAGLAFHARLSPRGAAGQHPGAWALTSRSTRRRFAARLNSGVRPQEATMSRLVVSVLAGAASGLIVWFVSPLTLGYTSAWAMPPGFPLKAWSALIVFGLGVSA